MDRPSTPFVDLQIANVGPAVEVRTSSTARVYRAPHLTFGHDVTIKVVPDSRGRAARLRFEREQLAMTRLSTVDGVLPLLEAGSTVDGDLYLMAPYVAGPTLQDRLASGPLDWDEAAEIMEEVAYTIHHAHVVGVVHRDLKPSTIVVEEGTGRAVVTELGFVGLTMDATAEVEGRHEDLVFTPGYSPPEAFRPGKPTLQLDVYSMGATLWALIVGRPPFTAPGDDAIEDVIERTETCRAGDLGDLVPGAVADVIDRAMAHHPGDRQDSAATLARELREARLDDPFFVASRTDVVAGWRPIPRTFAAVPVTEPVGAPEPGAVAQPPAQVVATAAESKATAPRRASAAAHAPVDDESAEDRRRAGVLVGAGVAAIGAVALAASVALILFVDDTDEPVRISGPLVESVEPGASDSDSSGPESPASTPEVLGVEVEPETEEEPNRVLLLTPFAIPTPTAVPTVATAPPPPTATPDEVISAPPPPTATPDEAISAPPPPTATPVPTVQPTAVPTPPPTPVPTVGPIPTTPATPPPEPTPPSP